MSVKFLPSLCIPKNANALPIPKHAEYPFRLVVKPRYRKHKRLTGEEWLQVLGGWVPEPMHPYQPMH